MLDRIVDATVMPGAGLVTAAVMLFALFWLVRLVGEGLVNHVLTPLFELYRAPVMALSDKLGPGMARDILVGRLMDGEIDFVQSLGVLTTGLFMPLGMVLPYVVAFYAALALLEDSGYLPRLATVTDTFFHRLGLHGHGIVPVLLGLGCKVPGILAARALETRRQRFIAVALVGITIPCAAHTATVFGILGQYGAWYLMVSFGTTAAVFLLLGILLHRSSREETPELFLDIPPYRMPGLMAVVKKTWMRARWFLSDALPLLFVGVAIASVMDAAGLTAQISDHTAVFMRVWFGLPGEAVPAMLSGFLRKEMAVGMLVPLALSPAQMTVAVTVFSFFPCIATLGVMLKELSGRDMMKAVAMMVVLALIVGGLLRLVLLGV
jgi:ferrous iron transport protein B